MKKTCFLLVGLISGLLSCGAFADVPDTQKATTKAYVDDLVDTKQAKIPAGTANTVLISPETAGGTPRSRAIYQNGDTWNSTSQQKLLQAGQANTAIQNGLNGHLTCAQEINGSGSGCLYWTINSANGTYMP